MTLTVASVRKYMHDNPIDNLKYDDKFFSDSNIETAIEDAVTRVEQLPPLGSGSNVPDFVIRYGALGILFEQKYINAAINYSPGIYENGIHEPIGEEMQIYQNISNFFMRSFVDGTAQHKVATNTLATMTNRSAISSWFRDTGRYAPNLTSGKKPLP